MTGRQIAGAAALVVAGAIAGRISLWLPAALAANTHAAAASTSPAPAPAPARRTAVDADPYALVADLRAALASPLEHQADALASIEVRWRGQPVHWRVLVPAALCRSADDCHAVPFDHASTRGRALAPIVEGWLPRLRLDAAAMARLACGDACTVELDGTVAEVTASTELPTAVTVNVAAITAATPARPTERWMR